MSFRSSTSSFRRSLLLGTLVCGLAWFAVEEVGLPRTAFYGGRKLAEKFVRLEALERIGPVDVFVIGPSHVDQGFDAGRFGAVTNTRAFNLGVMGTDMYFESVLLRDLLLRATPLQDRTPKAVLLALRDETLTRSNINRQYLASPALSYAHGPAGRWALALGPYLPQFQRRRILDWCHQFLLATRAAGARPAGGEQARAEWQETLDEFGRTELSTLTRQRHAPAGEREDPDERDDSGGEGDAGEGGFLAADYAVDLATAEAHVAETLRLLRARGIQVWLFFTPYYQDVFGRASKHARMVLTGQNAAYYTWVAKLAREFDLPVVDLRYCAEISGEPRFFYDTRHLNNPGSVPLAQLMGELFSGKRAVPALWSGAPAPAQFQAILGKREREHVPHLSVGERHALDAAQGVRREGQLLDAYASFGIERAGTYRVTLFRAEPSGAAPALYARFGGGDYGHWLPPPAARRAVLLETALQPGEHLLELHSADAKRGIDWSQILVEPCGP